MFDVDEFLELLDNVPQETNVVLTGRYAPKKLIDKG